MKFYFNFIFSLVLLIGWNSLSAQQDPMFTKYMFNSLFYNPAYAGTKGHMSLNAIYRNQWLGWNDGLREGQGGAPISQTVTLHSPYSPRVGYGVSLVNDKIGATSSTTANIAYSYKFPIAHGNLSMGLQAGVTYWRARWSDLNFKDPRENDPAFFDTDPSKWIPNFGAGVYYYTDKFYAGISIPRLLQSELRDNSEVVNIDPIHTAKLYRHLYFTGGAIFKLDNFDDFILKPSILIKSVGLFSQFASEGQSVKQIGTPTEFDFDISLLYRETFWFGVAYRSAFEAVFTDKSSHDSADIWTAFYLKQGIKIGLAYDFTLTEINNYVNGSFEIMLGYDFHYKISDVESPRYF